MTNAEQKSEFEELFIFFHHRLEEISVFLPSLHLIRVVAKDAFRNSSITNQLVVVYIRSFQLVVSQGDIEPIS
jgi:hypothetical protein